LLLLQEKRPAEEPGKGKERCLGIRRSKARLHGNDEPQYSSRAAAIPM